MAIIASEANVSVKNSSTVDLHGLWDVADRICRCIQSMLQSEAKPTYDEAKPCIKIEAMIRGFML